MNYTCKKTENCFSDSQTWEYNLPVTAEAFAALLDNTWEKRYNHRLRRPVFLAERAEIKIKGILAGTIIRVSFQNDKWEILKKTFEQFLQCCD